MQVLLLSKAQIVFKRHILGTNYAECFCWTWIFREGRCENCVLACDTM